MACDGLVVPATLRTYCRAAAVTSSRVAGGSKLLSGRMLRHMARAYVGRRAGFEAQTAKNWTSSPVTSTTLPDAQRHEAHRRDVAAVLHLDHPVAHRAVAEREDRDPAGRAAPSPRETTVRPCAASGSQVNWRGSAPLRPGCPRRSGRRRAGAGSARSVTSKSAACAPRVMPSQRGVLADRRSAGARRAGGGTRRSRGSSARPAAAGGRVAEVDRVERVGLAEGDHDREVVEPPHRLDLLVDAELVDPPVLDEVRAVLARA